MRLGFAPTETIDFMLKKLDKWRQPVVVRDKVRQKRLVSLRQHGFYQGVCENEGRVESGLKQFLTLRIRDG
jgi:hypothetical protein